MSECHRTKSLLKGIMIVFKTKGPQVRCIVRGRFGLSECKSSSKKTCWLIKSRSLERQINSKKRVRKYVAFPTGGENWLNVNRPAKNTLVLIKGLRI